MGPWAMGLWGHEPWAGRAGRAEGGKGVGPGGWSHGAMGPWGHEPWGKGPLKLAQSQLIEERGMGSGG